MPYQDFWNKTININVITFDHVIKYMYVKENMKYIFVLKKKRNIGISHFQWALYVLGSEYLHEKGGEAQVALPRTTFLLYFIDRQNNSANAIKTDFSTDNLILDWLTRLQLCAKHPYIHNERYTIVEIWETLRSCGSKKDHYSRGEYSP